MRRRDTSRGAAVVLCLLTVGLGTSAPADADAGGFWRSLLLPGWGQRASGHPGSAARFLAIEATLWASWAGANAVADVRARTYKTWASAHAGAQTGGKSKTYFDDLGFYASHHQHNQYAVVDDGPDAELYPDTARHAWAWDSEASRERYRELRNDAESMERNALYATGLLVVNHLVAAVHAARVPDAAGQRLEPSLSLESRPRPGGLDLALIRRF